MKKLITSILICFIFTAIFAEEFSLFPWMCNQKDIYDFCINKGWEYSADVSSPVPSFSFKTPESVTYHGEAVYALHFAFDNNNNIVSQAITLSDIISTDIIFASLVDHLVDDKARLISKSITKEQYYNITIDASINDKVNAKYVIIGQNNAYQISIAYMLY